MEKKPRFIITGFVKDAPKKTQTTKPENISPGKQTQTCILCGDAVTQNALCSDCCSECG